ncbi:hypothetical protein Nepgr_021771 [Nepenthes gracilis]|uniref:K+ potassium transporter integral membrane domain-containing protein n=1 Tax=Nepenthes gracilis TaxID=150966 RepID=A0AAD3SZB5_NEPGR|nr:hypothetical protein Nepgr_021771 [Nepenthes gracilis]
MGWAPGAKPPASVRGTNNGNPNAKVLTRDEIGVWETILPNETAGSAPTNHGSVDEANVFSHLQPNRPKSLRIPATKLFTTPSKHSHSFDKAYEDLMRAVIDCNKSSNLRANSRLNSPATAQFSLTFPPFPIEDYTGKGNIGKSDLTPGAIGSQIGVALPFQKDKEGQLSDRVNIIHGYDWGGLFESLTSHGFDGSMALLGRVGRGIHPELLILIDANFVGRKKRKSLKDHPRHPAVIVNKVGVAVRGIVDMESDLFGPITAFNERVVSFMSPALDLNVSVCVGEILLFFLVDTIPVDGKRLTGRSVVAKFMLSGSNSTITDIVQWVALSIATLDLWRPSTSPEGSSVSDGNCWSRSVEDKARIRTPNMMSFERVKLPVLLVAILSSVVGSQAIISGMYSIINQSQSLSCFPRVKVVHTSKQIQGQVHISEINWILMANNIVVLVAEFSIRVCLRNDTLATRGEIACNFIGCVCELVNLHGARCEA